METIKVKCKVGLFNYIKKDEIYSANHLDDGYYIYGSNGCAYIYNVNYFEVVNEDMDMEKELEDALKKVEDIKKKIEDNRVTQFPLAKLTPLQRIGYENDIGENVDYLIGGLGTFKFRRVGNFKDISFYLTCNYNWKIEIDDTGAQVLVPYNIKK